MQGQEDSPRGRCLYQNRAIRFAAAKHRKQRRKDVEKSPYINHPIEVASVLAEHGGASTSIGPSR
jgi:(p)ppGpp synthase/HD superfamily hydrolase